MSGSPGNDGSSAPIAIIGMGCRLPLAEGVDEFWKLLCEGVDAITEVPASRWDVQALWSDDAAEPGKTYCRWGGFVADGDCFDAAALEISPEEAVCMDPQQGMVLETAWQALEHAGIALAGLRGSATGVFVGISNCDFDRWLCSDLRNLDVSAGTGTSYSVVANRLSYFLGVCGPSIAVDLACASSLVAVHLARQSLLLGESALALAGGVHLILSPEKTITFSRGKLLARDGRCKSFAQDADGYVRGEGCGFAVLKRLVDAQRDSDRVLAVIRGSAVNHNGSSNGLSAPLRSAQEKVVAAALAAGGVEPASIGYVEAHSPGTLLGDLIEMRALATVLSQGRAAERACVVGSVKSNIGHLEGAAGISSLIKAVLAVNRGWIPRSLHTARLNSSLPLDGGPFQIAQQADAWPQQGGPRRAGVSSFSFGGANAHLVIEGSCEPSTASPRSPEPRRWLLPLSARTAESLQALTARYIEHLQRISGEAEPGLAFADTCYTASLGRQHFNERLAIVAGDAMQALNILQAHVQGQRLPDLHLGSLRKARPAGIDLLIGSVAVTAAAGLHQHLLQHWLGIRNWVRATTGQSRSDCLPDLLALTGLLRKCGVVASSVRGIDPDGAWVADKLSCPDAMREIAGILRLQPHEWQASHRGTDQSGCEAARLASRYNRRLQLCIGCAEQHSITRFAAPDAGGLLLNAVGAAYVLGINPEWQVLFDIERRCSIPRYAFIRHRHWRDPGSQEADSP